MKANNMNITGRKNPNEKANKYSWIRADIRNTDNAETPRFPLVIC
jgi:hypothetical protein